MLFETGPKPYTQNGVETTTDDLIAPGQVVEFYLQPDREINMWNAHRALILAMKVKEQNPDMILHYIRIDSDRVTVQASLGTPAAEVEAVAANVLIAILIGVLIAVLIFVGIAFVQLEKAIKYYQTQCGKLSIIAEARCYLKGCDKPAGKWPLPDAISKVGAPLIGIPKAAPVPLFLTIFLPWLSKLADIQAGNARTPVGMPDGYYVPVGDYTVQFGEFPEEDLKAMLVCKTPSVTESVVAGQHTIIKGLYQLVKAPPGGIIVTNPCTGEQVTFGGGEVVDGPWPTTAILEVYTFPVAGDIYLGTDKIGTSQAKVELDIGVDYTVAFGLVDGYVQPTPITFTMTADGKSIKQEYKKEEEKGFWASLPSWAKVLVIGGGAILATVGGIKLVRALPMPKKKEEKRGKRVEIYPLHLTTK